MSDEITDPGDRPRKVALEKYGRFILAALRRASPSDKGARSWFMHKQGADVLLTSFDLGVIATDRDWDHMTWGRPPFHRTNAKRRGRTHWITKAVDRQLQTAAETFRDAYAAQLVADTEWSEED